MMFAAPWLGVEQQAAGDPFYDNVILLLHAEGTPGATGASAFIDNSKFARVPTTATSTLTDTQALFGSTSILNTASPATRLAYTTNADDFAFAGDFTIEFAVYGTNTNPGLQRIMGRWGNGNGTRCWFIRRSNTRINFTYSTDTTNFFVIENNFFSTNADVVNHWTRFAFVRSGTNFYTFINGVLTYTDVISDQPFGNPLTSFQVGAFQTDDTRINTFPLDEIRITDGVARYNATYEPATEPFPDM